MSRPHRVPLALLLALSAFASSAQQLPPAYVARLAAQPWQCAGPDLAVVPCGRSRIADECRFRLSYLAACVASGPKGAPARAALQACVREANPSAAGGMALAFLTFDKAAAAAIAAASPACPHLRGVKAATGAALDRWNPTGGPAVWLSQVKAECTRLGKLVLPLKSGLAGLDALSRKLVSAELAAAEASLAQCARLGGSGQAALGGGFAHSAGQALERARRLDALAPRMCIRLPPQVAAKRKQQRAKSFAGKGGALQNNPLDECAETGATADVPQWNRQKGRVWFPPGVGGAKKLPLLVYLHGNIKDGSWGAGLMLADDATLAKDSSASNIGRLAAWLQAAGKVGPVIIAAPSDLVAHQPGTQLWSTFELSRFVEDVERVRQRTVFSGRIDYDRVAVVGWSGAAVWKGGLNKIARQGGQIWERQRDGGRVPHPIKLFGLADGEVQPAYAEDLSKGLAASPTTVVYSVHKGGGGNKDGQPGPYADVFGARRDLLSGTLPSAAEQADKAAFAFYREGGDGSARFTAVRTVAKIKDGEWDRHLREFLDAKASATAPGRTHHDRMPLVWSWYGLQRFFPP